MAKRKLTDIAQMNLRLPEALRRRVEIEAKKYGRSLNNELVRRIQASFDQQEIEKIIKWTAQETARFAYAYEKYADTITDDEEAQIEEAAKQELAAMMKPHQGKGK